jgi:hypothetical protein
MDHYEQQILIMLQIIRNTPLKTYDRRVHSGHIHAPTSDSFPLGVTQGLKPLQTIAGGDCFFASLSWHIFGSQACVAALRLCTGFMLVKYFEFFDTRGMR